MAKPFDAEGQPLDQKSILVISGKTADFAELAKDCVCFANGSGGKIVIGIEDDALEPDPLQRISTTLVDRTTKRVGELTVNVSIGAEVVDCSNGGQVLVLTVARAIGVASTSDGRYFLRVGDACRPVVGDDVMRLVQERPAMPWEAMTTQRACEKIRLASVLRPFRHGFVRLALQGLPCAARLPCPDENVSDLGSGVFFHRL